MLSVLLDRLFGILDVVALPLELAVVLAILGSLIGVLLGGMPGCVLGLFGGIAVSWIIEYQIESVRPNSLPCALLHVFGWSAVLALLGYLLLR